MNGQTIEDRAFLEVSEEMVKGEKNRILLQQLILVGCGMPAKLFICTKSSIA
jgi:hypothetical protein